MSVPKPTFDDSFASLERAVEAVNAERTRTWMALSAAARSLQAALDVLDGLDAPSCEPRRVAADLEATLATVRAALRAAS